MLQLAGKNNVAPLFLDEPSKFVSKGHSENVAKFLFEVSSYFDRQVFMVTHDEFLAKTADKAYHFRINDGKTVTTPV
jgi:ABC-type lipoprotein export system ATPase subunit